MKIILSCALFLLSMNIFAGDELSLDVKRSKASFVVTLAANPTTGYQWTVENFDRDLFTLSNTLYQRPQTNLIGAGGQMLYTFSLNKGKSYPAQTDMVFKYARAWEPESAMKKTVVVHFVK